MEDIFYFFSCDENEKFDHVLRDCSPDAECITGVLPRYPDEDHHEACPPPGSDKLVLLPSYYCDAFYICM